MISLVHKLAPLVRSFMQDIIPGLTHNLAWGVDFMSIPWYPCTNVKAGSPYNGTTPIVRNFFKC